MCKLLKLFRKLSKILLRYINFLVSLFRYKQPSNNMQNVCIVCITNTWFDQHALFDIQENAAYSARIPEEREKRGTNHETNLMVIGHLVRREGSQSQSHYSQRRRDSSLPLVCRLWGRESDGVRPRYIETHRDRRLPDCSSRDWIQLKPRMTSILKSLGKYHQVVGRVYPLLLRRYTQVRVRVCVLEERGERRKESS